MNSPVRVVMLEDNPSTADHYRARLNGATAVEFVGQVAYGEALEPFLAEHPADVALLDISVPTSPDDGAPYPLLQMIPRWLAAYPRLRLLIISMHLERALIQGVLAAGAHGYILKDDRSAIERLPEIIQAVAAGEQFLSEQARRRVQH